MRDFGDAGGVRIVEHRRRATEAFGREVRELDADPRPVQVNGGADYPIGDDAGEGETDSVGGGAGLLRDVGDDREYVVRLGRLRCLDPDAVGGEDAAPRVDERALDAGPADVYAQRCHAVTVAIRTLVVRPRSSGDRASVS